jgi:hypothetical protein
MWRQIWRSLNDTQLQECKFLEDRPKLVEMLKKKKKEKYITPEAQMEYKYGINIDGLSDAEKLLEQLLGPQLLFKQHSPYYPW